MTRALTERQAAVLAYVVERGNCSAADVTWALSLSKSVAFKALSDLLDRGLVGKQRGIFGDVRWFAEQEAPSVVPKTREPQLCVECRKPVRQGSQRCRTCSHRATNRMRHLQTLRQTRYLVPPEAQSALAASGVKT